MIERRAWKRDTRLSPKGRSMEPRASGPRRAMERSAAAARSGDGILFPMVPAIPHISLTAGLRKGGSERQAGQSSASVWRRNFSAQIPLRTPGMNEYCRPCCCNGVMIRMRPTENDATAASLASMKVSVLAWRN